MIQLPVRVELRDRSSDRSCSFTISQEFVDYPRKGDHIIIDEGYFTVNSRMHFCDEKPSMMVVTAPMIVDKYDDMLRLLDWFKDQYEITEFQADSEPASYYSLYRSIIRLLQCKPSKRLTDHKPQATMKAFSAAASAVLVAECLYENEAPSAEDFAQVYADTSPLIETLLNIVLNKKHQDDDNEVDFLQAIKEWEPLVNPDSKLRWQATEERCLEAGKIIFGRLNSIPAEMLPDTLK